MVGPTKKESQRWSVWASPGLGVDGVAPRYPRVGKTVEGAAQ